MKYVVAAVLLAFLSVAVPNLRQSMQRSREKRTMGAMRDIATRLEEHASLANLPRVDGWGTPFELFAYGNDYSIRAYGSDHRRDATIVDGPHTDFARDIVFANGTFVSYPEGL